jgi:hypothetical protein
MKTYGGVDVYILVFLTSELYLEVSGQIHDPAALATGGKKPRYQLDRRLGEPQSRSDRYGEVKILDPTGTRNPTPRSSGS